MTTLGSIDQGGYNRLKPLVKTRGGFDRPTLLAGDWSINVRENVNLIVDCFKMSRVVSKAFFAHVKKIDTDRLCGNDQRLCFRYTDSTIPLLPKFQAFSCLV